MKISVCICTCDRPELLEKLLGSLRDIELGDIAAGEVDLVIVDNNPTGAVRAACTRVAELLPIELHFVEEPERGISFARNRAVAEALARGADFVAFIDDDDIPEPDWLRRLMEEQRKTRAEIVGGVWRNVFAAQTPDWLKAAPLFHEPVTDRLGRYGIPIGMGTFNVLLSRGVLERFAMQGPIFAPELSFTGGGDTDLFIRAKKAGASFALAERSVINRGFVDQRLTARGVLTRAFRYGCTATQMKFRHRRPARIRRHSLKALLGVLYSCAGRTFDYYR